MVGTLSTMLELGTRAPDFELPNTNRGVGAATMSLGDFSDAKALLVVFMCNHCPYVIHIRNELVRFANEYGRKGLAVVAISANDATGYPADGPDKMTQEAAAHDFPFPYLYDEEQAVAKAYRAACTPDFFLFDADRELVYRGQFDGSRPRNDVPVTGADIRRAVDCVLRHEAVDADQKPSMGCNIKWKAGREPSY
ncbi:MAG: redoxin domain-containing protein [Gammaproteobacteria bacterium]|nr:thioredoxin family protein [Gammaproteobacteria bacterium]NIV75702.1 redoxin domain-containing protein [Gammaproteobacteria bacterium]